MCYPYSEGVSEAIVKPLFLVKMSSMSVKEEESISEPWDFINYLETHERNVVFFKIENALHVSGSDGRSSKLKTIDRSLEHFIFCPVFVFTLNFFQSSFCF